MSLRVKVGLVLVVTVACLAWALHGMDPRAALDALSAFHPFAIVPLALLLTLSLVSRTLRLQILLDRPLRFRDALSIMGVGFLAINVVPLRMGEFVRPYLLQEQHGVPFGSGMAAIVLERLLDMLALLVCLGLVAWTVDVPPGAIEIDGVDLFAVGQRVLGTSVVVGLVGVLVLVVVGAPAVQLLVSVLGRVSATLASVVDRLGGRFVDGFRSLARSPVRMLGAFAMTAIGWIGTFGAVHFVMDGFPGVGGGATRALLTWTTTLLGMTLVPTPGFIGSFEAACVGALKLLGGGQDVDQAFSVLLHFLVTGYTIVTGVLFLAYEGWSLGALVRESREAAATR